jgi:acyl-CoA synthetase (AMP-forming)/AMP-acid ligase II
VTARTVAGTLTSRAAGVGTTVRVLGRAGVIRPYGPRTLLDIGRVVLRWGTGPAGGFATLAARSPHQVGVVDELGELTWGELHRRSNSLARALAERGVREGDSVAVMCRNHRGFVDASIAVAKLGADILYLNTAFAGPQLVDVLEREAPSMIVHDEEFGGLLAGAHVQRRILAWTDGDGGDEDTLERLVTAYDEGDLHPPARHARIVILTSGTTGTPKGAPRKEAGIDAAVSLLSSTRGASRTSPSRCCWAPRSCCAARSTPPPPSAPRRTSGASRWW